jgi:hypothetical protein
MIQKRERNNLKRRSRIEKEKVENKSNRKVGKGD